MPRSILFCHGLESAPIGRKSQGLIDLGHDVVAPDCRGKDLAARIELLTDALTKFDKPPVVVGSSFGGIAGLVATILAARAGHEVHALILCAPALQLPPPPDTVGSLKPPCPTTVVHGLRDEVIDIEHSRAFASQFDVPLVEVDDDHGLGAAGFDVLVEEVGKALGRG